MRAAGPTSLEDYIQKGALWVNTFLFTLFNFSSEYLPIAGKKVNIHYTEKGDWNYVNKRYK